MTKKSLFSASLLLAISSLISRGLGVWRDHLFATMFGANGVGIYSLDTYYAAFRIPDLLYSILVFGTISVAFMPIFSDYLAKKDYEEGWKFASNVLNLLLLIFISIAVIVFIFAEPIMQVFVYGFTLEQVKQTAELVRIMLFSPLFFAIASIAIGVENSFQKFTAQAWAPVLYNLGIIIGAFLWGDSFGVYGLVWGVVLGAFLYMLIQIPGILALGFRWFPILSWKRSDTKEMFGLVLPRIISLSAMQVNLVVDTFLGSSLVIGSLTILNLAQNLQSLPFGIISISVAITSFSLFTRFASEKNWDQFNFELRKSVRITLYLLLPSIVGMYLMRNQIIALVLQGGNFGQEAAQMTSNVLALLLLALVAQGLIPIFARAFFALKNTKLPLVVSLIAMVVNLIGSFYFAPKFGVNGLALANVIGMWVNLVLLYSFLSKKSPQILSISFVGKIFFASTLMGVLIAVILSFFPLKTTVLWAELVYVLILTGIGLIFYSFLTHGMRLQEAKILVQKLFGR